MAFFSSGDNRIKLMTLYILKSFRTPITWEQLYTCMAFHDGPEYFAMGELYTELSAEGYIVAVPAKGQQLISLTQKGAVTCDLFSSELAKSTRESIIEYADEKRQDFKKANSLVSDATPLPSGAWDLSLSLLDTEGTLFELRMRMPSADYAYRAQQYWAENSDSLYLELMKKLTAQGEE